MNKILKEKLPKLSGIYLFKDSQNNIIYIGKAKDLSKRVGSYFAKQNTDWKIQELIKEYEIVEHIVTKNETEALLLEADLIKKYKPKFNVLLKSGNPFLYIVITKADLPEIKIIRIKKEKGDYFGPFLHKSKARSTYEYIIRTFSLGICKNKIDTGCLDYHLGRCAGTCMPTFDKAGYLFRLELARKALNQDFDDFSSSIKTQIAQYNKNLEFEKSQNLQKYLEDSEVIFKTIETGFSEKKYLTDVAQAATEKQYYSTEEAQAGLLELKKILNLTGIPETLDCFDISHFQSSYMVGSCIRFKNGTPDKNMFRRFKIKTLTEQNDYAALQEIVNRRYKDPKNIPDIILIDGGKGQLSAIEQVLPQANLISLAKREETIYSKNFKNGIKLDIHTPLGKLLIGLRDYAHHFAIQYHRLLRKKGHTLEELDLGKP